MMFSGFLIAEFFLTRKRRLYMRSEGEIILVLNIIVTKELLSLNVISVGGPPPGR